MNCTYVYTKSFASGQLVSHRRTGSTKYETGKKYVHLKNLLALGCIIRNEDGKGPQAKQGIPKPQNSLKVQDHRMGVVSR